MGRGVVWGYARETPKRDAQAMRIYGRDVDAKAYHFQSPLRRPSCRRYGGIFMYGDAAWLSDCLRIRAVYISVGICARDAHGPKAFINMSSINIRDLSEPRHLPRPERTVPHRAHERCAWAFRVGVSRAYPH
jgi:hypothetical protein